MTENAEPHFDHRPVIEGLMSQMSPYFTESEIPVAREILNDAMPVTDDVLKYFVVAHGETYSRCGPLPLMLLSIIQLGTMAQLEENKGNEALMKCFQSTFPVLIMSLKGILSGFGGV